MNQGWIKLHRKLLDNPIFQNEKALKVWIWCLLKASHSEKECYVGRQLVKLKEGQFIYGRLTASEQLCMTNSTVRNWMNFLQQDNYLDIKSTNKYSLVTIINWIEHQIEDNKLDNKVKTNGKQMDTNKKEKNVKNENKETLKSNKLDDIIEYFNQTTGALLRSTPKKKIQLNARLKTFSIEQIKEAIKKRTESDFHKGINKSGKIWFKDWESLFRNDEKIEQFLQDTKYKPTIEDDIKAVKAGDMSQFDFRDKHGEEAYQQL